jgi:hypothetical protein
MHGVFDRPIAINGQVSYSYFSFYDIKVN